MSAPSWLRPYPILSNSEQFRANLACLVCDSSEKAVVDEFSSIVDRPIAKIGALHFVREAHVTYSCHWNSAFEDERGFLLEAAALLSILKHSASN